MNLDQCAYEFSHKLSVTESSLDETPMPSPNNVATSTPVFRHLSVCDTEEQTSSGVSRSNTPQLSNTSGQDSSDCSSNEPSGRIRRKRQRRYDEWKDIKRKRLKNLGKAYLSRNGVLRDGKILKPPCPITCRLKCYQKFNAQDRNRIFTSFWQIGDHCRQWDYIVNHTKVNFTNNSSRRKKSIKYCLPLLESNSDIPNKVSVCRTMFLNTLSVGERTVQTALAKWRSGSGIIRSFPSSGHPHVLTKIPRRHGNRIFRKRCTGYKLLTEQGHTAQEARRKAKKTDTVVCLSCYNSSHNS
ncbi:unnamed protein product [Arctia plantaginis]|uniref:Uncharacterized protein n=1 Tax=Arctia plantaginis TaxID=874455 RepID=A0A8S0ZTH9_ARCPL|nr:unnamed protein product [Arctia plantaginis]